MKNLFANLAFLEPLIARYNKLPGRDQFALKCLTGFALLIIIVFGLLIPINEFNRQAQLRYLDSMETLAWMESNKTLLGASSSAASKRDPGQSLLGLSNKTAKAYGLTFKRYQPVDDNGLNLWLEDVSFNSLVLWLDRLNKKYNISVKEISIDRDDQEGMVNVRLFLQG